MPTDNENPNQLTKQQSMQLPGYQVYLSDADPGEGGRGASLALVCPLQREWYQRLAAALLDHQSPQLLHAEYNIDQPYHFSGEWAVIITEIAYLVLADCVENPGNELPDIGRLRLAETHQGGGYTQLGHSPDPLV